MTAPLAGKVVLVTRPAAQGGELTDRLAELGARVLVAPAIVVEPAGRQKLLDSAIREAADGRFAWVAFTSASGVRAWTERAGALDAGSPRASVAAVGDSTAAALRRAGIAPDLQPATFTTAALGQAFPDGSGSVLLPRADLATEELEDALRRKGWTPVRVDAYKVSLADSIPAEVRRALDEGRVDVITFTSPSTVEGFTRLMRVPERPAIVCIGPVTADAARRAGFRVAAAAQRHTTEGLVDAVLRVLR